MPSATSASTQPAADARRILIAAALGAATVILLALAHHFFWRYHVKRLTAVRPGVFYRVAQPTEFGARHLVERHGIKTLVSLQLFDFRLKRGLFDTGDPDGTHESHYVLDTLGIRHVQWPMGDELCWPWPSPWELEEFFRLVDEPANHPIAIHCMGGRHRTGTLSALFRLEYDRWTVEDALTEMYSYNFGNPVPLQDIQLRTYLPRPRPRSEDWKELEAHWSAHLGGMRFVAYDDLVRELRARRGNPETIAAVKAYLGAERPFAIELAHRLVDDPAEPLARPAAESASRRLARQDAAFSEWATAAAIVADFGTLEQQEKLLGMIDREVANEQLTRRYRAVAAGVMNRYTSNRIAFLRPILFDARFPTERAARGYRYCDIALSRLVAIVDRRLGVDHVPLEPARFKANRSLVLAWIDANADRSRLCQLQAPWGERMVKAVDAVHEEDLSRARW